MNAAETIAAAIEKLERLWNEERHNLDPYDEVEYFAVLHHTTPAQLAILRDAKAAFEKVSGLDPDWGLELDLARAILGEEA